MITLGEYGGHVYISGAKEVIVIVIVQVAERKMEHFASVCKIRRRGSDFVFSIGNFLCILVRFTF